MTGDEGMYFRGPILQVIRHILYYTTILSPAKNIPVSLSLSVSITVSFSVSIFLLFAISLYLLAHTMQNLSHWHVKTSSQPGRIWDRHK